MASSAKSSANSKPSLILLFLSFLKLGSTAFGGPAMVAYIRRMAVVQKKWLDDETFQKGIALCQSIPGATAMQMAAYTGFKCRRGLGAVSTFVGFGLPAFVMMVVLSALYVRAHDLPIVVSIFRGLQAIIVAIVANAVVSFAKASLKNWKDAAIVAVAALLFLMRVNPIIVILLSALLGLLLHRKRTFQRVPSSETSRFPIRGFLLTMLGVTAVCVFLLLSGDRRLFHLAILMLRIDLFAFGGGFASLPIMYHEVVDVRSWVDSHTFLNGIALGQVTPGPIIITATFIGYMVHGVSGAVIATLSIFLPSLLLVIVVTPYFDRFQASPHFNRAIAGIFASFVGLLLTVGLRFALDISWNIPAVLLAVASFAALLLRVEIIWVVLVGVVISALLF